MKLKLIGALATGCLLLTACGGGGSSSASVPMTPESQAPVAAIGAATGNSPNTVTNQATIPTGTVGFALAQTKVVSAGSTTTAANGFTGTLLAYLDTVINAIIKPAYAQQTTGCVSDALKLVGIDASGIVTDIQTTEAPATCDIGFREIYDAGNYVMLTGEGLYKNNLTCNIVFLHKETGKLFCVGENYTSRYTIKESTVSSSSGTTTAAPASSTSTTSPAAEKVQIVKNQADPSKTDYILVSTRETAFDSNGQTNGVRIKLLRFNLKDLENGPSIKLLAEGLEQNWMQQASSNENLSFNLENFKIARNGDVFAIYSYYLWTRNPWSSTQKRNVNFFVYDDSDNVTIKKVNGQSIQDIIDQMNNLQRGTQTPTYASTTSFNWYSIPCMFDDPESTDSVIFTTPFWTWNATQNGVTPTSTSSSASLIIKASGRSSGSAVGLSAVKVSQVCADTNAWAGNAPVKVVDPSTGRDVWFTTQTAYVNGYYNNQWFWGTTVSLVGNDFTTPRDGNGNPTYANNDLVVGLSAPINNGTATNYYNEWQNSRSVHSSKDYLYVLRKTANFSYNDSVGNTIFRFKPFDQNGVFTYANQTLDLDATAPTMGMRSLQESAKVWVTSVATSPLDNIVNLVGRDLNSDNFERVFGKIDENGNYSGTNITSSKYSSFTIVRM